MSINEYLIEIRRLIEKNRARSGFSAVVFLYQVGEDETLDHSLISQRAYGSRIHGDVVRIACGISFSCEKADQKIIVLPKEAEIIRLQKKFGVINAFR